VLGSRGGLSCEGGQADLFFSEDATKIEQAKILCAACSRRSSCLAGALERREPWGVWGGELFDSGSVIQRKRPRGRPRKHRPVDPLREAVTR
jgi:WhiB family redox-sensing transcriptional regulator